MKKTLAWILALVMILGLCACGEEEEKSLSDKTKKPDAQTEQTDETESPEPSETETQEPMDTVETTLFTVTYPHDRSQDRSGLGQPWPQGA